MTEADRADVPHPRLPGRLAGEHDVLADRAEAWPVTARTTAYTSPFISVQEDTVSAPSGEQLHRTTVTHPGAVGVVAVDDERRVLLLEQYRHPVRRRLLEIPAGLMDVDGETAGQAAARELAEEADLVARDWEQLAMVFSSPGFTDERLVLYAARGLSPLPDAERTTREAEEADMTSVWVPLERVVDAVLDGRIGNQLTATGVLAVHARLTCPRTIPRDTGH